MSLFEFAHEFMSSTTIFVIAALTFCVGISMNNFFQNLFNEAFSVDGTLFAAFLYLVFITIFSLVLIFFLQRYKSLLTLKLEKKMKTIDKISSKSRSTSRQK